MLKFKPQYIDDLKPLYTFYKDIEKTHRGLGKLCVMMVLSDIANKCLFVVGISGTGKSRSMELISRLCNRAKFDIQGLTLNGLAKYQNVFNESRVTVLIDDLSRSQTDYSIVATAQVFTALTYSGSVRKTTGRIDISIRNFKGSAILLLQPVIYKKILENEMFEAEIRDKSIRYYHLRRPVKPNDNPINAELDYKYLDEVIVDLPPKLKRSRKYQRALHNFRHEHSIGRAEQHLDDYLKACALANGRLEVTKADLDLIEQLSRNFRFELSVFTKEELEGNRYLDPNMIALFSVLATHKKYPVSNLTFDFQVRKSRLYQILENLSEWCYTLKNSNRAYIVPSEEAIKVLKEIGEW